MQDSSNNIKKLTTNNFKAENEPEADNASEEDGPCHLLAPTSAPSEDSDSSEESDGSSLDMANIFPQVTYGNKRSSDGNGTLSTVLLIYSRIDSLLHSR
ncbi:hypothetical protein RMATCC62417_01291 [Rhizopus microsporus]|nr:hypothetical protein RMATCC62417_01289 [Rhizopus microsporus]CEG64293.1 hypothetical protein RMATCC62417_01291 [Rhizopus microsporus]